MIDRKQIETDVRAQIEASPSNHYIVYLNTDGGNYASANVVFEGDLETAIQSFLNEIDDEGAIINKSYTLAVISSIEEFDMSKSDFS